MNDALPYRVSYAAEKAKCEKCRHTIKQGALQIAIMVQSNEDDCQYATWYHQQCFFKTRLPLTEAAFDGFALLRYDHQLAIKKDLGIGDNDASQTDTAAADEAKLRDFLISYAPVTRDSCTGCRKRFKQKDMRIMRVVHTAKADKNQNGELESGRANWYHVACFVRQRSEIGWLCCGDLLPGFKRLSDNDKEIIQKQIPDTRSNVTASSSNDANSVELEKQIEVQNHEYFKVYDYIKEHVSEEDRFAILNCNKQTVPAADDQMLHHLTDVIYFGAMSKCKSCKKGELIFCNWAYKCTNKSGWTSCGKESNEPVRTCAKFPTEITGKYPFLEEQCGVRARVLHFFKFVDDQGNDSVYAPYKKPLLFNMEFVLIGTFKQARASIVEKIKKLGGKVGTQVHDRVAAVISTMDDVQSMDKQMKDAKMHGIQVVTEDFVDEIQAPDTDPILHIISKSISDWGGDPYARIEENEVSSRRETIFYTKSLPEKITLKWKDGTVVDPECGLDENAHVYSTTMKNRKVCYSVILGLVDIQHNKNSYYRMQLLESNDQNLFWVFESWGRIGTVIGSKQLKMYGKLDEALEKFHTVYADKTGNTFGNKVFQKKVDKFYHLDVEFGQPKKAAKSLVPTKLDAPVHDLMQMLFDIKKMENMMCGCDLDLKQMPLGKISAKQIKSAMTTLYSISKLIQRNASTDELRDASNKFYTMIPHTFGVKRVPIIDSVEAVSAKNEMLESLLNMETIYSFLENENGEKIHPLDGCYDKLNASIVPIAKDSAEFKTFCDIASLTHGPTHNTYTLEILEIFKVVRDGEEERFQQHLGNHRLLWHGSRLMNFASILSNGLKIAPPEAPASGYMFGKGIYFADVVSKSANYCFTDSYNNTGLMMMCEVALGNSWDLGNAYNVTTLPNAEHQSVKGFGIYTTQNTTVNIDGLDVPYGLQVYNPQMRLHYNEYIVYDIRQVKIKYLFKMKFHFKPNIQT